MGLQELRRELNKEWAKPKLNNINFRGYLEEWMFRDYDKIKDLQKHINFIKGTKYIIGVDGDTPNSSFIFITSDNGVLTKQGN